VAGRATTAIAWGFSNVSTESNLNAASPGATSYSTIENELPTYRAVSPRAVAALVCGVLAVTSYASPYFLVFAALAVVLGISADRRIQRMSDVLTGRRLAQAGIGLGMIFGLTALSINTVQGVVRKKQAEQCAREYLDHLKKDSFEQLAWFGQSPTVRMSTTPDQLAEQMSKDNEHREQAERRLMGVRQLKNAVDHAGAEVHFEAIESHGEEGLDPYAAAIFEVHTPNAKDPEERERHALVFMKAAKSPKGQYEWYVESVTFPYQKATFSGPVKPVDDGHGHAH
jgi:hypothetical protein